MLHFEIIIGLIFVVINLGNEKYILLRNDDIFKINKPS